MPKPLSDHLFPPMVVDIPVTDQPTRYTLVMPTRAKVVAA